jgi:outer membrane protein insertion porin family
MSYFRPHYHRRNTIAMKFQGAMITGFGGKNVPPYNRFYLGGEQDVRGYDFYTISPFVVIPIFHHHNISFLNPRLLNQQGVPTQQTLPVNVLEYIPTRPGGRLASCAESGIPYPDRFARDV